MEENTLTKPVKPSPPVIRYQDADYVTVADAASVLGVHLTTVYNLINSHRQPLRAEKIGPVLYVTVDSLEAERSRREAALKGEVAA